MAFMGLPRDEKIKYEYNILNKLKLPWGWALVWAKGKKINDVET